MRMVSWSADAIHIQRIGDVPLGILIDDGDAGYARSGNWVEATPIGAAYEQDWDYSWAGTGADTTTWTFNNLESGQYQVFGHWRAAGGFASDAPFSISDGTTVSQVVDVNQEAFAPADVMVDSEAFGYIGAPLTISGGQLVVELSDDADNRVVADAIYVQRVGDEPIPAGGSGSAGPVTVAGDFNGDGKPDLARQIDGTSDWYAGFSGRSQSLGRKRACPTGTVRNYQFFDSVHDVVRGRRCGILQPCDGKRVRRDAGRVDRLRLVQHWYLRFSFRTARSTVSDCRPSTRQGTSLRGGGMAQFRCGHQCSQSGNTGV